MLTKILSVIVAIIAVPFIAALFIKKEYTVEREIIINKPHHEIFDYIKFIKNQDNFSVWNKMDPDMKKAFTGEDGKQGFIYAWDGNKNAGQGEQEIRLIKEGEMVETEVRFIRPFEGIAHTVFATKPLSGNETLVTWKMTGKSSYPMNIMNLFIDNMLGDDIEKSLLNLREILEHQKEAFTLGE